MLPQSYRLIVLLLFLYVYTFSSAILINVYCKNDLDFESIPLAIVIFVFELKFEIINLHFFILFYIEYLITICSIIYLLLFVICCH